MESSRKSFTIGILVGFVVGVSMVGIVAAGLGYMALKNPHGALVRFALSKAHLFTGVLGPLVSMKHLATSAAAKLKDPALKAKYPFSFQEVPFSGSRVERSGSLVSWIAPFSDRVGPDVVPPGSMMRRPGKTRPVRLIGLKGETLSFQIVLRAKDRLDNVAVSLRPGPGASCIEIHRFKEIYLKVVQNQGGTLKKIVNPDPLIPFTNPYSPGQQLVPRLSLSEDKNQPVWFDIHLSDTCQGGDYTATLRVEQDGRTLRNTPIKIHVVNATLPKDVGFDRWMQLYMGRFFNGEYIANDQMLRPMLAKYFAMAHKYGFAASGCLTIGPNIQWDQNTGRIASVDWSKFDSMFGDYLSGNLTGSSPNAWCLPSLGPYVLGTVGGFTYMTGTPSELSDWKKLPRQVTIEETRAIVRHWKEKGWPLSKGFVYVWDEPMHQLYYPAVYKLIAEIADAIHDGSDNQIRVMLTDDPYIWDRHETGHHKSVMYDKIDIWSPSSITYIPDKILPYQKKGKRAWFYQGGPPFTGQSDITGSGPGLRMWFWTAWKYKLDGLFYWAADFWSGNAIDNNPYTHGGTEDGVVFYPGHQLHFIGLPDIDGPVPSIRMAQWRRGYDDYRYFVMLKEKGKKSEVDAMVNGLVRHALNDGGYFPYWRIPLWHRPGDWNHDPRAWHKARVALAEEIEKLYSR
ncbi:MAG: DUF4091 domain-containing protein [Nitrospirae bacterium]|nr:DUF4091 domain-containing protein [Nitrospirota bacterium]MCL5285416.1 DUF4091 domain-containing protein [Nitrospirota bacterium]